MSDLSASSNYFSNLQGLFDLFKEDLNGPSAFVEPADAGSGPVHVVGDAKPISTCLPSTSTSATIRRMRLGYGE
ncbi:MAG: hypothetical protein R6U56_03285 [Opitutales bacterium]